MLRLMGPVLITVFMNSPAPWSISAADPGGGTTFWLPKDEDVFFARDCYTGAEFMAFRRDGTYVQINREHMLVAWDDSGRWTQREDGNVMLCSDYRYQSIHAGSITIAVVRKEYYDDLPAFRDGMTGLLERGEEVSYTKAGVKASVPSSFVDYLHDLADPVPREDLEELRAAIAHYIQEGEANLFVFKPWTCSGRTYLIAAEPESENEFKEALG